MALAVDASVPADSTTLKGATTSTTLTISTSGTNRIVLVFVATENQTTARTVSSVTATGLTFVKRSGLGYASNTSSFLGNMECWWAYAAAQLSSTVITVNISGACDAGVCGACAISGVTNFANPWDTNASLPATTTNGTSSAAAASLATLSTDFPNTMVIGFWSSGNNPSQSQTRISGYTLLGNMGTNIGGAVHDSQAAAEEQVFSSPQTNLTVGWTLGTKWWGMIADAITADIALSIPPQAVFIS